MPRRSMNMSGLTGSTTSRSRLSRNHKINSTKATNNLSVERGLLELQLPVIGLEPKIRKKVFRGTGISETPRC